MPNPDRSGASGLSQSASLPASIHVETVHASGRSPERVAAELIARYPSASTDSVADLAIAFATEDLCTERAYAILYEGMGRTPLVGCSTFGQMIGGEEPASGIALATLRSDEVRFKTFSVFDLDADPEGHADDVVESIRETCTEPAAAILLVHGFAAGVDVFARRIGRTLPRETQVAGALACGDPSTQRTYQIHNERMMTRGCSIVVLDGPVAAYSAVSHGLVGLGRPGVVTAAADRWVRAIDGEPAIELYRRYLGDRIGELPGIGQTFPLGFGRPGEAQRVRSVLDVDEQTGALRVSGPVEEGAAIRVMLSQRGTVARETRGAAERIRNRIGDAPIDLALVFGQYGRGAATGSDTATEAQIIRDALQPVENVLGFRTLGAIGRDGVIGSALSILAF